MYIASPSYDPWYRYRWFFKLSFRDQIICICFNIAIICICIGVAWLIKKIRRLKKNNWKYVPPTKWRGDEFEVRAYLSEGGLQNLGYSPDEGVAEDAMIGIKRLDAITEGTHTQSCRVSGSYKEWPLQLSAVRLKLVEDRYDPMNPDQSASHEYFSGTWCIFPIRRKLKGELFLVDCRLGNPDGRHGPGKHTRRSRVSLGSRLATAFYGFGNGVNEEEVENLLTDDLQLLLLRLREKYRLFILMTDTKVHIGISGKKHLFRHREEETVEDWREKQTLFETLDDLTELVSHFGTPPSEDEYFF